jgi:hypothetical protein
VLRSRNPLPVILAFLAGFYLARTGAAPYIAHVLGVIGHDITHA